MSKYWIAVASKEHVLFGVQGGFAQVCHGKVGPLKLMKAGDFLIYYSPSYRFGEKDPCRAFTAIGQIKKGDPYPFQMSPDFIPYRRSVQFFSCRETLILPLIENLSFIFDKTKWGFPFRKGCFSISETDFQLIALKMEVDLGQNIA